MAQLILINTRNSLDGLRTRCISAFGERPRVVGVDTEGSKWYWPQDLCTLVQLNVDNTIYIIDTLSLKQNHVDITSLKNILEDKSILKVFHDVSSDKKRLQSLFDDGVVICNVFDTMIAATYLKTFPEPNYATLVKELLNVDVPKTFQSYDFTYRSHGGDLHADALTYAAGDVKHIINLYNKLRELIQEKDLEQEVMLDSGVAAELKEATAHKKPALFKEITDIERIRRLNALYIWRKQLATLAHIPPYLLIPDRNLKKLSESELNITSIARNERKQSAVNAGSRIFEAVQGALSETGMPPAIVNDLCSNIISRLTPYNGIQLTDVERLLRESVHAASTALPDWYVIPGQTRPVEDPRMTKLNNYRIEQADHRGILFEAVLPKRVIDELLSVNSLNDEITAKVTCMLGTHRTSLYLDSILQCLQ